MARGDARVGCRVGGEVGVAWLGLVSGAGGWELGAVGAAADRPGFE